MCTEYWNIVSLQCQFKIKYKVATEKSQADPISTSNDLYDLQHVYTTHVYIKYKLTFKSWVFQAKLTVG